MVFSYNEYFEKVFIIPIIILLIIFIDILYLLYRFRTDEKYSIGKIEIVLQVIGVVILAFVSVTQLRFGIVLDNEDSTRFINGEITDISDVRLPPKYYLNGDRVWPKLVEIDDEKYYIMAIGDFEMHDQVKIEYLNNSKIVISIIENGED